MKAILQALREVLSDPFGLKASQKLTEYRLDQFEQVSGLPRTEGHKPLHAITKLSTTYPSQHSTQEYWTAFLQLQATHGWTPDQALRFLTQLTNFGAFHRAFDLPEAGTWRRPAFFQLIRFKL